MRNFETEIGILVDDDEGDWGGEAKSFSRNSLRVSMPKVRLYSHEQRYSCLYIASRHRRSTLHVQALLLRGCKYESRSSSKSRATFDNVT
jgi:hypothetical protein